MTEDTAGTATAMLGILRRHGWVKERFGGSEAGGYCIRGAWRALDLAWVEEGGWTYLVIARVIEDQYLERAGLAVNRASARQIITRFNDHPETTFADVEMVLEKAAAQ